MKFIDGLYAGILVGVFLIGIIFITIEKQDKEIDMFMSQLYYGEIISDLKGLDQAISYIENKYNLSEIDKKYIEFYIMFIKQDMKKLKRG